MEGAEDIYISWRMVAKIVITVLLITAVASHFFDGPDSLPPTEGHNAEQAYKWFAETHTEGWEGELEGPTCSLMARCWVDEYRDAHNLTPEEYPCAIWLNSMEDYFIY